MKFLSGLLIASLTALLSGFTSTEKTQVKTDSYVRFVVKNAGINVNGQFKSFSSNIKFNKSNIPASIFNGVINVSSIDTDIKKRDDHLKKEEYFDAAKHTGIVFKSTAVSVLNANTLKITGNLTIKATTKQVILNMTYLSKGENTIFTTKLNLNRRDYGVGGKSTIMSDNVAIDIKISVKTSDIK